MPEKVFRRPADKIIFILSAIFIVACAAFVFLNNETDKPTPSLLEDEKIKIAATIIPVENIVKEIGGDKVEIALIVPEGQSPHTFEPTPEIIKNVSDASIVFKMGAIDDWVNPLLGIVNKPEFNVGDKVELMSFKETPLIGEEEEEEEYDPHYWLSIKNGKIIAENITRELTRLDGDNADYYVANLSKFFEKADKTDAEIREILSDLVNRRLITFHNSWGYFAADYGLEVVAVYQPSPGKDPLPQDVSALIDKARKYGIDTFFSEAFTSSAPFEAIGKDEEITVVSLNPLGERGDYLQSMKNSAMTIKEALK